MKKRTREKTLFCFSVERRRNAAGRERFRRALFPGRHWADSSERSASSEHKLFISEVVLLTPQMRHFQYKHARAILHNKPVYRLAHLAFQHSILSQGSQSKFVQNLFFKNS